MMISVYPCESMWELVCWPVTYDFRFDEFVICSLAKALEDILGSHAMKAIFFPARIQRRYGKGQCVHTYELNPRPPLGDTPSQSWVDTSWVPASRKGLEAFCSAFLNGTLEAGRAKSVKIIWQSQCLPCQLIPYICCMWIAAFGMIHRLSGLNQTKLPRWVAGHNAFNFFIVIPVNTPLLS